MHLSEARIQTPDLRKINKKEKKVWKIVKHGATPINYKLFSRQKWSRT